MEQRFLVGEFKSKTFPHFKIKYEVDYCFLKDILIWRINFFYFNLLKTVLSVNIEVYKISIEIIMI